jgi:hypothetical protein
MLWKRKGDRFAMLEQTLKVANEFGMWISALIMVSVVVLQSLLFTRLARKTAREVGFSDVNVKKSFKSGMITALGPSIAQFVALISFMAVIGGPMAWMNLSIIGSATTDLSVATMSATAADSSLGNANFSLETLAVVLFCLAVNGCGWMLFCAIFTPKMESVRNKLGGGDAKWLALITSAASIGVFANLTAQQAIRNYANASAALGGFVVMLIVTAMSKKFLWMREYKLAFSIIFGLLIAGVTKSILG